MQFYFTVISEGENQAVSTNFLMTQAAQTKTNSKESSDSFRLEISRLSPTFNIYSKLSATVVLGFCSSSVKKFNFILDFLNTWGIMQNIPDLTN